MKEQDFVSYDGKVLHLYVFDEVLNAKGVVQIAHGMQEYCATYFDFAKVLNQNGFYVVMFDERSHGKTCKSVEEIGAYENDLFCSIVRDQAYLSKLIKAKTSLPLTMFAHSYGSFIGQKYIQNCDAYDKIILSGTSYMKTPTIFFAKIVAKITKMFKGRNKKAKLIEKLSFGAYKKHFQGSGSWICCDEEETKKFYADKHCGTPFSVGFYEDMFCNQLKLYKRKEMEKINKEKPILIFCGKDDIVGNFGKGPKRLLKEYEKYGLNVNLVLKDGMRHSLIQETKREQVFSFIIQFIEQ
ncbi:MAG: alpha/beta hydrolase [Clostridia bacterium]